MNEKQKDLLKKMASPFGNASCLEEWIGKENGRKADKLAKRYLAALEPSKRAIREGAISHLIELTAEEKSLLEIVAARNIPW